MTDKNDHQSPPRTRVDVLLVERGLFESRARARAAIEAGGVVANGRQVQKSSEMIANDAELSAEPAHPWVSRGGVKLAGALEQYPIDIEGHVHRIGDVDGENEFDVNGRMVFLVGNLSG